ncbi:hypothetical protein HPB49_000247 [Dermacentor silvarum]|uniref:Uncharacterized protein n=1 Tax=Dermacentor silvarum TaxID=543639 RepID=A0ACB8CNN0_DERSI|nr:hypothetical protein HPB49_000247 [Dermacentor silvarum]
MSEDPVEIEKWSEYVDKYVAGEDSISDELRDQLAKNPSFFLGLTNAMSLGECITVANAACHAPSKVVGQVEVGMQCCLPLADKSVACSFKAGSESRSVQTTEVVDQSSFTSGER